MDTTAMEVIHVGSVVVGRGGQSVRSGRHAARSMAVITALVTGIIAAGLCAGYALGPLFHSIFTSPHR